MENCNILCIGDVHIQTNNTTDIKLFISKLEIYIKQNNDKIDIIILMGDILHTHERLHTIPFNIANELFNSLSKMKPLYVLVGNHDYINNSQFLSQNHWMNCFKHENNNIHIIDTVTHLKLKDKNVVLSPYVSDGKFTQALDTINHHFNWKNANCIFGHQLLDGVKMGAILTENVEKWENNYPLLVSGHIHDKQKPQENLYYTGSCMQHAFGESSDKTICLVTINGESEFPKLTEINLDLPQKKILYYDIEELDNNPEEIEKILNLLENKNIHYKITISGNFEQFKLFKKNPIFMKLQKNGTRVIFKNKLTDILNKKHLIKNTDSDNFKDILLELIENVHDYKKDTLIGVSLLKIYNQFYNTNNIYNNKKIELID
jgi:DNA repair exonuclease SbcCD nuclease subunit